MDSTGTSFIVLRRSLVVSCTVRCVLATVYVSVSRTLMIKRDVNAAASPHRNLSSLWFTAAQCARVNHAIVSSTWWNQPPKMAKLSRRRRVSPELSGFMRVAGVFWHVPCFSSMLCYIQSQLFILSDRAPAWNGSFQIRYSECFFAKKHSVWHLLVRIWSDRFLTSRSWKMCLNPQMTIRRSPSLLVIG